MKQSARLNGRSMSHNWATVSGGALLVFLALQSTGTQAQARTGLIQDWSARYAVFARIGPPQAMNAAQRDPRALQSWRKALVAHARASQVAGTGQQDLNRDAGRPAPHHQLKQHTDWSINLGGQGPAEAMFPAKFSFDINATPDCTNDFVVFPVNQAPNSTHENLVAFNDLYSGTLGGIGICNRTASASDVGTSAVVKWSYAIQSADNAGVMTSPALSLDGTKVAFVTSKAGQQPHFHVLAWASGDGVNPANLQDPSSTTKLITSFTALAPAAGSGTATDLAFGASAGGPGDTLSSPFIDYVNDTAYIGDDKGNLVRIKDVFCTANLSCSGAAPSLDTSWGTSGTVSVGVGSCSGTGNSRLTGAIADSVTGNVYVGCADGKLYGFNSSGAALANSPVTVGNNTAIGALQDAPIVDGINRFVYAFSGNNGTNSVAVQANFDLSSVRRVPLGAANRFTLHAGEFNDAYFSSSTSTNWFLYAQGYNGGGTQTFLYWIGFDASRNMNTLPTGSLNTRPSATECSPMTEFLNGTTDRLFLSLLAGNVLNSYDITATGAPPAPTQSTQQGGTSGIIVDNVSTQAQASSIYFSPLANQACGVGGTGRCAVKLTQSGLL